MRWLPRVTESTSGTTDTDKPGMYPRALALIDF